MRARSMKNGLSDFSILFSLVFVCLIVLPLYCSLIVIVSQDSRF
mgnify:FL=1